MLLVLVRLLLLVFLCTPRFPPVPLLTLSSQLLFVLLYLLPQGSGALLVGLPP